jgi:hypothetical protein
MPIPLIAAAAIGAGSQIIAGYMANQAQGKAIKSQKQMFDEVNRQLAAIGQPQLEPMQFQQIQDKMAGLNPEELYKVAQTGPSEMQDMQVDRTGRNAQLQALSRIQQIGSEGGLTAEDKANLANIQMQADSENAGQQAALQEAFQRRGVAGGGQEMAARMNAQQNAANQARMGGLQTAASARSRALEAIMQGGQLGGQLQGADTSEAQRRAQAIDATNQFNTQLLQGVYGQRGNAGIDIARNSQGVENSNVGIANKQQEWNKNTIPMQKFDAGLAKVNAAQGVASQRAGVAQQAASQQASSVNNLANAVSAGANAYGQSTADGNTEARYLAQMSPEQRAYYKANKQ